MILLAIIRFIVVIVTMVIWLTAYGIRCIFFKHTPSSAFALRKHWLKYVAFPILNLHVKLEGKPMDKAAIYVCNHRSFLDPVIVSRYLDAYVIAKAEVAKYPVINTGARLTGVLYVNRASKDSRNEVREKMVDTIENGFNILVFPEGTVGVKQTTLPFRKGTFYESLENNIDIIPVALDYRDESDLWVYRNLLIFYLNQFSKWKIEAKLTFGDVITATDGEMLAKEAETWVNAELLNMHKNWSRVNYDKFKDHKMFFEYKDL